MDGLGDLARDQILSLSRTLLTAAITASVEPLSQIVTGYARFFLSWLTPTRENDTLIAIEKRLREEDEDRERRQRDEDDIEHLQQLQAATRAIQEREATLAREAEDRRIAKEKRQDEERRIKRETEERNVIEAARKEEEKRLVAQAEGRRVARETKERSIAEAARKEEERRVAKEAEERRVAEEARQAKRRRIEETRHAEMLGIIEEQVRQAKERQDEERRIKRETEERNMIEAARKEEEQRLVEQAEEQRVAQEIKERSIAEAARKEEERRVAEEAEERRIAEEARQADRRRIEDTRHAEILVFIEGEVRRVKERQDEERRIRRETEERNVIQAARKEEEQRLVAQAEGRRTVREIKERKIAEAARKEKEERLVEQAEGRRIMREIKERKIAGAARKEEERRLAEEAEERRIARETKERNIAEAARKEEERRLAEQAKERRIAEEARETERRRIAEETRHAEVLVLIEAEIRRTNESLFAEAARQLAEEAREANRRKLAEEAEERRIAAEALEAEEAAKLKDQRIKLEAETIIVAERVRQAEMVADERYEIQQAIAEKPHPTGGISKDELARAKEKLQWVPGQFRFAVSGASGSGKSSLINIFLNLPDNHANGAATDVVEATLTVRRYLDPGDQPPRKWTVWYDLPGAGTQTFDDVGYFKRQCMYLFDLVLVVFDNRFTKIDLDIIRDCALEKIPCFIIRSKADAHIKNHMKSSGYESDNDPEDTQTFREKSREHVIAKTRANVESELKQAGLPPQRVYIVSCSKQFRREYSAFISGSVETTSGKGRARFVDEMELIHDLMLAAHARRCDIQPQVATASSQTATADRTSLIGRLRTGQTKALGVRIRCPCEVKKKNVEHILLECLLTKDARSQAKKALGRRNMTLIGLLYNENGHLWAEKIWEKFMEARKTMREDDSE